MPTLCQQAQRFAGLTPVDKSRTEPVSWMDVRYIGERVRLFDETLQKVCTEEQVAYLPLFDTFLARQAKGNLLIDGLHPNDADHQLLYGQIQPKLQKKIYNA